MKLEGNWNVEEKIVEILPRVKNFAREIVEIVGPLRLGYVFSIGSNKSNAGALLPVCIFKFSWSMKDKQTEDGPPAAEPEQGSAAERVDSTGGPPAPELSPRPPSAPPTRRDRPTRPVSSYGVRSFPSARPQHDDRLGSRHFRGTDAWGLEQENVSACDDEELLAKRAVRIGDRVMVQSGAFGELPDSLNKWVAIEARLR